MCRIFYNPGGVKYPLKDLHGFFKKLELVGGRDGNGIYNFDTGLYMRTLDNIPEEEDVNGHFLFHTRMATHGDVAPYNCQPFVGDRYILVHNGIFTESKMLSKYLFLKPKFSDSYCIHRLIEERGIMSFWNGFKDESFGVVVVHDRKYGKTYLLKSSGSFTSAQFGEYYVYASSSLDYWKDFKPKSFSNGMWILEDKGAVKIHTPENRRTYYNAYNYGNYYNYRGKNNYYSDKKLEHKPKNTDEKTITVFVDGNDGDHEEEEEMIVDFPEEPERPYGSDDDDEWEKYFDALDEWEKLKQQNEDVEDDVKGYYGFTRGN